VPASATPCAAALRAARQVLAPEGEHRAGKAHARLRRPLHHHAGPVGGPPVLRNRAQVMTGIIERIFLRSRTSTRRLSSERSRTASAPARRGTTPGSRRSDSPPPRPSAQHPVPAARGPGAMRDRRVPRVRLNAFGRNSPRPWQKPEHRRCDPKDIVVLTKDCTPEAQGVPRSS
jgi:hypothetical protein